VQKAEADRVRAKRGARGKTPLHDGVCFHCQQCAEKYLKALLEELGITIPKIHNLVKLLEHLRTQHPSLRPFKRGLSFLTPFAIATRYPGEDATRRQAQAALRWMERVRTEARRLLGI
jgi:HEPN domain-containing protein